MCSNFHSLYSVFDGILHFAVIRYGCFESLSNPLKRLHYYVIVNNALEGLHSLLLRKIENDVIALLGKKLRWTLLAHKPSVIWFGFFKKTKNWGKIYYSNNIT